MGGWKAFGEGREREAIKIRGRDGVRCLGWRLEVEGRRKTMGKPRLFCR